MIKGYLDKHDVSFKAHISSIDQPSGESECQLWARVLAFRLEEEDKGHRSFKEELRCVPECN